jgi:hypothetical protein
VDTVRGVTNSEYVTGYEWGEATVAKLGGGDFVAGKIIAVHAAMSGAERSLCDRPVTLTGNPWPASGRDAYYPQCGRGTAMVR